MTIIRKIQLRRDTAANWTTANPVLLSGEVGLETDTRKEKTGNGVTAWTSLAYSRLNVGTTSGTFAAGDDTRIVNAVNASGVLSALTNYSPARRRSVFEKMASHRHPNEMFCRWEGNSLQVLWLYPSGKSIYTNIVKNTNDDCYVHNAIYSATHSEAYGVIQTKNYTVRTGTWSDSGGSSSTSTVGATITLDFIGTGIDIRRYADHRGGIWSCVLDGSGDPYLLDTYVASGGPIVTTRLITDLPFGPHRLVCTLTTTPNPANVSGLNRGWMSIGAVDGASDSTFDGLGSKVVTFLSTPITIRGPSNTEFALAARAVGSVSTALFMPDHGTGTVFLRPSASYRVLRDGKLVSQGSTAWVKCEQIVASGKYYGRHTDAPTYGGRLCDIDVTHTITREGVQSDVDIKWVVASEVDGYSAMFPQGFATQVETDLGATVSLPPADNVILTGSPWVGSLLATKPAGTADEQALWCVSDWSATHDGITRPEDTTARRQLLGVDAIQWIAPTGKIYNHVLGSSAALDTVAAGTRHGWRLSVAAGYF